MVKTITKNKKKNTKNNYNLNHHLHKEHSSRTNRRTACATELSLGKETTSYDDIFDALRLTVSGVIKLRDWTTSESQVTSIKIGGKTTNTRKKEMVVLW